MKKILKMFLLLSCLFLLCGCLRTRTELTVKDDGSVDMATVVLLSEEILQQSGPLSEEDLQEMYSQLIVMQTSAMKMAQAQQIYGGLPAAECAQKLDDEIGSYTTEQCAAYYDAVLQFSESTYDENLRMLGNLACLVDRYESLSHVRFCFDCGHEHCYTKTVKLMDVFTNRVCCTHIHDNHGRPFDDKVNDHDEHLLPFDGTYDYEQMMRKLDEYGYAGSLMLEVAQNREEYRRMTHEAFLSTCYERIRRISEL
jgi:hypothetical protein